MSQDRHTVIPAVWVFVTNEKNEIFLLRRANTGWRDGYWTVPAGHVEKDEGPTGAAVRELEEEAGLHIEPSQLENPLVYFYPADDRQFERVSVFFTLKEYTGTPKNAEPHKADQSGWFDIDNLPEKLPPLLKRAIFDISQGVSYSERYYNSEHHPELLQ